MTNTLNQYPRVICPSCQGINFEFIKESDGTQVRCMNCGYIVSYYKTPDKNVIAENPIPKGKILLEG